MKTQLCPRCGRTLLLEAFKTPHQVNGKRYECRDCDNARGRDYYARNKESVLSRTNAYAKTEQRKAYNRKYQREYQRRNQERLASRPRPDVCEMCSGPGGKLGIMYDHDHTTGAFRGWLCGHCNSAIGMCKDNAALMRKLIAYVENGGPDA